MFRYPKLKQDLAAQLSRDDLIRLCNLLRVPPGEQEQILEKRGMGLFERMETHRHPEKTGVMLSEENVSFLKELFEAAGMHHLVIVVEDYQKGLKSGE